MQTIEEDRSSMKPTTLSSDLLSSSDDDETSSSHSLSEDSNSETDFDSNQQERIKNNNEKNFLFVINKNYLRIKWDSDSKEIKTGKQRLGLGIYKDDSFLLTLEETQFKEGKYYKLLIQSLNNHRKYGAQLYYGNRVKCGSFEWETIPSISDPSDQHYATIPNEFVIFSPPIFIKLKVQIYYRRSHPICIPLPPATTITLGVTKPTMVKKRKHGL